MRTPLLALGLSGALALPAAAQIRITRSGSATGAERLLEASPEGFGIGGWQVGQWARYSVSENAGAPMPLTRLRSISVVGRRGDQFWVESQTEFTGAMQATGPVRKMLIPFGALHEAVNGETYSLMPDSSVRRETLVRAGGASPAPAFPQGWTRIGEEDVTVVAGAFHAVHWRKGGEDLWLSASAAPVGVVKYASADMQIELVARGDSGARSRIPFGGN
jgi:hypothetical protein